VAQVAQSPNGPVLILSDPLCLFLAMVDSSSTFQQDAEMVICRLSGEVVASLNRKDLDRVKETSGNSIRALKHEVAELCGESVYRIKLVSFDGRYLQDDDLLTDVQLTDKERDVQVPMDLQMLLQEFLPPSDEERVQFLVAASSGDATTLDTLLSKPMDPNTTIPFSEKKEMPTRQLWATTGLAPQQLGSSALQLACVGGHTDCARSLVDAKAELETTSAMPRCVVGKALYEASLQGHWEIVQLLAEANADVDSATRRLHDKRTPIQAACEGGFTETVQVLLKAGAKKPLLEAGCLADHAQIVRLLMDAGVDKDEDKMRRAILCALRAQKKEVLKVLLTSGADANWQDKDGRSLLWTAADENLTEIAELLLEAGADKDTVNEKGISALWTAADHGCLEMVKLLLKAGADHARPNKNGRTAIQIAQYRDHPDVVDVLQKREEGSEPSKSQ